MGLWAVLVYVFLFLPIVFVVAHSFNSGRSFLVWDSFSTQPFSDFWERAGPEGGDPHVARRSPSAARSSPTVLGGFAGVALARRGGGWVKPFMFILLLVLVTPEIVDAIGYLIWFVRLGGPLNPQHELLVPAGSCGSGSATRSSSRRSSRSSCGPASPASTRAWRRPPPTSAPPPARAFRQITLPLMAPALRRRRAAVVHLQPRQHDHLARSSAWPASTTFPAYVFGSVRPVLRPVHRRRGHRDAAADARRAGHRRPRAPPLGRHLDRRRRHPHRRLSAGVAASGVTSDQI